MKFYALLRQKYYSLKDVLSSIWILCGLLVVVIVLAGVKRSSPLPSMTKNLFMFEPRSKHAPQVVTMNNITYTNHTGNPPAAKDDNHEKLSVDLEIHIDQNTTSTMNSTIEAPTPETDVSPNASLPSSKDLSDHVDVEDGVLPVDTTISPNPPLDPEKSSDDEVNELGVLKDDLENVLATTADANKTVILTALNSAWAAARENGTMIDLFLESFHIGVDTKRLLDHLLIVTLDAIAYNRCLEIHPHCYILRTRGVDFSAEKQYMTKDYMRMMWRRLAFLGDILKRGYNFIFTDTDIMWLRNPLPIFSQNADVQIASDMFNGDPEDINNSPNCGFKFIRSNNRTIAFYDFWYKSRKLFPTNNEQEVLNILKRRSSFMNWKMKFLFLDTKNFGGYCSRSPYIDEAYTMHANCCRGLKAKLIDLRTTLDEFEEQQREIKNMTTLNGALWSAPKACPLSWGP